jgi:hypothetical protein
MDNGGEFLFLFFWGCVGVIIISSFDFLRTNKATTSRLQHCCFDETQNNNYCTSVAAFRPAEQQNNDEQIIFHVEQIWMFLVSPEPDHQSNTSTDRSEFRISSHLSLILKQAAFRITKDCFGFPSTGDTVAKRPSAAERETCVCVLFCVCGSLFLKLWLVPSSLFIDGSE